MKTIPFDHQSHTYEVRIITCELTTIVRAFYKGRPANHFSYEMGFSVAIGFQRTFGLSVIDCLVHEAMLDITEAS